jgi:hypothetical protein
VILARVSVESSGKHRIAMWAGAGFLIAGFWALHALAGTHPALTSADR